MSTINPLFLDSTKPVGDKVVTNVELFNILLRDGDTLFFEVTDQFGFVQRFAMKKIETKKAVRYTAEVWLKYQHQIRYRFVIVSDGQELYTSAKQETRAGHIISEKWEPCLKIKDVTSKKERRASTGTSREIKATSSKPLCKPQFFDQIKSLLDDLL